MVTLPYLRKRAPRAWKPLNCRCSKPSPKLGFCMTSNSVQSVRFQLLEIALLVADMPGKLAPFGGFHHSLAREFLDAVVETPSQLLVAHVDAIHRDDRIIGGHASVLGEVKQGRHEFPPGQVTGSTKNDEYRRFE